MPLKRKHCQPSVALQSHSTEHDKFSRSLCKDKNYSHYLRQRQGAQPFHSTQLNARLPTPAKVNIGRNKCWFLSKWNKNRARSEKCRYNLADRQPLPRLSVSVPENGRPFPSKSHRLFHKWPGNQMHTRDRPILLSCKSTARESSLPRSRALKLRFLSPRVSGRCFLPILSVYQTVILR